MKIIEQKDTPKDIHADLVAPRCRGKRISTPADVLIQKRWIALNISQDAIVDSTRSLPVAKSTIAMEIEKDEIG